MSHSSKLSIAISCKYGFLLITLLCEKHLARIGALNSLLIKFHVLRYVLDRKRLKSVIKYLNVPLISIINGQNVAEGRYGQINIAFVPLSHVRKCLNVLGIG